MDTWTPVFRHPLRFSSWSNAPLLGGPSLRIPRGAQLGSGIFLLGKPTKMGKIGVSQKECKQNTSKNNKKPQWTTKSCTWLVKLYLVGGFDPFEKILVKSLTQVDQVGLKITNVWNNHLDPNFFLNSFSGKIRPSKRPVVDKKRQIQPRLILGWTVELYHLPLHLQHKFGQRFGWFLLDMLSGQIAIFH